MVLAFRTQSVSRKDALTSTDATDEQLIATGNIAVFAELYDRHVDSIYRYCRLRLPDATEAEDATAMVFEKAFAAYPPAPTGTFRGWLFTIAHNIVADSAIRWRPVLFSDLNKLSDQADRRTREATNWPLWSAETLATIFEPL